MRYTLCLLAWLCTSMAMAQSPCEINNVHTNPDPAYVRPSITNADHPYHSNRFDWKRSWWPINWPNTFIPPVNPPPPLGADYIHIISPFYSNNSDLAYFAKHVSSDFQPSDGWELVAYDFGMEYNSETTIRSTNSFSEGYLILYNKHTSTLRALVTPLAINMANMAEMRWILEPQSGEDASGLFAGTGGVLNPLDQPSPTRNVSTRFTPPPNMPGTWLHGDVSVFYDPCSCQRDQQIRTDYVVITDGYIKMYGLYAGTVSTLDAATDTRAVPYVTGVIQNPGAYLASLDAHNVDELKPGSLVAKDMNALADNYELWVEELENPNFGSLLTGIFDVLSLAGDAAGLFSPTTYLFGEKASDVFKGVGVASKLFSKIIKPGKTITDPGPYLPSYTQGEISLRGTYTTTIPLTTHDQLIALPGTPWTTDDNLVAPFKTASKPQYPLYNETLGLFAILHAPKVKVRTGGNTHIDPQIEWYDGYRREWRQYQFDGDLDYVWNPASHVDVENTRIHAALIVEQSATDPSATEFCPAVSDFNVINGERLYDSDVINDEAESSVYATEFVGLECLSELPLTIDRGRGCVLVSQIPDPGFFRSTDSVVIRLVMDVRFKPNEYGVRNRSTIIYTLPVELVDEEDTLVGNGMPVYDENLTVGSITHTNPYEKFVHSTITINGEVKTNPTTNLASYVAGEKIVVQSGATIGMNTRLALDYGTPCGKPRIAPYSGDLNAFCSSNQYKAKEIINEVRAGDGPNHDDVSIELVGTLYARVEMRTGTLEVVSESTDEAQVRVDVYDILGNLLTSAMGQNTDEALTRTMIDTKSMAAGGYVLVVSSGGRSRTLKILYAP